MMFFERLIIMAKMPHEMKCCLNIFLTEKK
jgi:hypothetical protein